MTIGPMTGPRGIVPPADPAARGSAPGNLRETPCVQNPARSAARGAAGTTPPGNTSKESP